LFDDAVEVNRSVSPESNAAEENYMRPFAFRFVVVAACAVGASALACSVSTTDHSITFTGKTKYTGDTPATKTASASYTSGDVIEVENANGDVRVTGVAGLTSITVTARPFAWAESEADGRAGIMDVTSSITIDESVAHKFYIHCSTASASHGTAPTSLTGCDAFTVQVPTGASDQPLILKATAHNGPITASGLFGNAIVHSDNGDASASVTPTVASAVEVSSGNGSASLALPADFTADAITLTASGGAVTATDFPDWSSTTSSHRQSGGARSIIVETELGDVTLRKQ
jgi:hypothetical protein